MRAIEIKAGTIGKTSCGDFNFHINGEINKNLFTFKKNKKFPVRFLRVRKDVWIHNSH